MKQITDLLEPTSGRALRQGLPFPPARDRASWEALPEELRRHVVDRATRHLDFPWPSLTAERYLDFMRNGDRGRYQDAYFTRRSVLAELVVAECMEDRGRFVDQIVNGIWLILDEASWVVPAHNSQRIENGTTDEARRLGLPDVGRRFIDLFAAETGALLAATEYLLSDALDRVTPVIRDRMRRELGDRIIDPYLEHEDFWWMSLQERYRGRINNWNPWCNRNCLVVFLTSADAEAAAAGVHKAVRSLDAFLASYGEDGACDEGPSYWGHAAAALFDGIDLLDRATEGALSPLFGDERVRNMGGYLARMHLSGDYYANFADASAHLQPPPDLIYRYGCRTEDAGLRDFAAYLLQRSAGPNGDRDPTGDRAQDGAAVTEIPVSAFLPTPRDFLPYLQALFNYQELAGHAEAAGPGAGWSTSENAAGPQLHSWMPLSVWLPSVEVAVMRRAAGREDGFVLATKGGHNGESHNHNDVGQIILLHDGEPVLIDPGVGVYTATTFSKDRYTLWTMQSAFHNLPTIGGTMQEPGRGFAARGAAFEETSEGRGCFSLDIGTAYPASAGIERWHRTVELDRARECVVLRDTFSLDREQEVTWSFMTLTDPLHLLENGAETSVKMEISPGAADESKSHQLRDVRTTVETIHLEDSHLQAQWGSRMYRLLVGGHAAAGTLQVTFRPR